LSEARKKGEEWLRRVQSSEGSKKWTGWLLEFLLRRVRAKKAEEPQKPDLSGNLFRPAVEKLVRNDLAENLGRGHVDFVHTNRTGWW